MLTLQKAYENWQTIILEASDVEVSIAHIYLCLDGGIPYTQVLYDKLHTRIETLRALLTEIEADALTHKDTMGG